MARRRSRSEFFSRRPGLLLAVLALLAHLALPVAAFAASAGPGGARVPVCTGTGIVWMLTGAESSLPAQDQPAPAHCPLCGASSAPILVAPAGSVPVPWPRPAEPMATRGGDQVPATLFRTAHRSRAPPVPA